jgi:hypothetical protein
MSSRTERLKNKALIFAKEQYDELSPKEVKRIGRFLKSKEPRFRTSYNTRKVRGKQTVVNMLNRTKTKIKRR